METPYSNMLLRQLYAIRDDLYQAQKEMQDKLDFNEAHHIIRDALTRVHELIADHQPS